MFSKSFSEAIQIANQLLEMLLQTNSLPRDVDPDNRNLYLCCVKSIKALIVAVATMEKVRVLFIHQLKFPAINKNIQNYFTLFLTFKK